MRMRSSGSSRGRSSKLLCIGEVAARRWLDGDISQPYDASVDLPVPDRPSRLSNVKLLSPQLMPKLGKAGSLQSRQAILHSLVHTESWAIDLSWDIIARSGKQEAMPVEFFTLSGWRRTKAGTSLCLLRVSRNWVQTMEHYRLVMASGILPLQPLRVCWVVLQSSIVSMR